MKKAIAALVASLTLAAPASAAPVVSLGNPIPDVYEHEITFGQNDSADSIAIPVSGRCSLTVEMAGADAFSVYQVPTASTTALGGTLVRAFTANDSTPHVFSPGHFYIKAFSTTSSTGGSELRVLCSNIIASSAGGVTTIADIDAGVRTGLDGQVVTGTPGTAGNVAIWNADGDIVDGGGTGGTGNLFQDQSNTSSPQGPNYRINVTSTNFGVPTTHKGSVILSPGNTNSPNQIGVAGASGLPTTPHPDYTAYTPLAISTPPSWSSVIGYDSVANHQSANIIGPHHFIGSGDGGGHITVLGGSSAMVIGDCEFCSLFGANKGAIEVTRRSTLTSKSNLIVGGEFGKMDFTGLTTYGTDGSFNIIANSLSSTIEGASYGGMILNALRSGIIFDGTFAGSSTAGDEGISNLVTGNGSAVTDEDPGDGTEERPSYASASGLGARSWMDNMACVGNAHAGDIAEGSMSGTDGSVGATGQFCRLLASSHQIQVADPTGTYTNLTPDRSGTESFFFTEDGVWHLTTTVVCSERNSQNPLRHFASFEGSALLHVYGSGAGTGTARFYNDSEFALTTVALTRTGHRSNNGADKLWTYDCQLASRDGAASLDAGFDVQCRNNQNSDAQAPSLNSECFAAISVNMLRDT